jgi:hypothetical protein
MPCRYFHGQLHTIVPLLLSAKHRGCHIGIAFSRPVRLGNKSQCMQQVSIEIITAVSVAGKTAFRMIAYIAPVCAYYSMENIIFYDEMLSDAL